MMIAALKKAITASISDVLETMFFMVIEFNETDKEALCAVLKRSILRGAALRFNGPFSGEFTLLAPLDLLKGMAVDFMGESPDNITMTHADETLKEALNMIVGNTFSHYDDTILFTIGIPEVMKEKEINSVCEGDEKESILFKVRTEDNEILLKLAIWE